MCLIWSANFVFDEFLWNPCVYVVSLSPFFCVITGFDLIIKRIEKITVIKWTFLFFIWFQISFFFSLVSYFNCLPIFCNILMLLFMLDVCRMFFLSLWGCWRPKSKWLLVSCTILLWKQLMLVIRRYMKLKSGWSHGWTSSRCRNSSMLKVALPLLLQTLVLNKVKAWLE